MNKKSEIDSKIEELKNISNNEKVINAAEIKKEKKAKKIQQKIKEEKELHTKSNKKEEQVKTIEEAPLIEKVEDIKIDTIDNIITQDEIIETVDEKITTEEDIIKTDENKKNTTKQTYSVRNMCGYDWMGVIYDE